MPTHLLTPVGTGDTQGKSQSPWPQGVCSLGAGVQNEPTRRVVLHVTGDALKEVFWERVLTSESCFWLSHPWSTSAWRAGAGLSSSASTPSSARHRATLMACPLNGCTEAKVWKEPGSWLDCSLRAPTNTQLSLLIGCLFSLCVYKGPSEGSRIELHLTPCFPPGCPQF